MLSLSALSTSAMASARTPRLEPIRMRRRCLRVITVQTLLSAFQPETLDQLVQPAKLVRILWQRAAGLGSGASRLVLVAQHHIGAKKPQPSLDVGTVLLEPCGGARHHAAQHLGLPLGRKLAGRRNVVGGQPRRRRLWIDTRKRFAHQAD